MYQYAADMRIAGYSQRTIEDRCELIERFRQSLPAGVELLAAAPDHIRAFQLTLVALAPASQNIYARHIKALFDWAEKRRLLAGANPADEMTIPRVPKGRPHPTALDKVRVIIACAVGGLRTAYILATFAGLRSGEIARLTRADLDLHGSLSTALINGKGGKQRTVPLLSPVIAELERVGLPRSGWIVTRDDGCPYTPKSLSEASCRFLHGMGMETTLHSMRSTFATHAARLTRDPLLVRDLLGHASVSTTEIYMQSTLSDMHVRLAGISALAENLISVRDETPRSLRAIN